jgi:hypothetical protein
VEPVPTGDQRLKSSQLRQSTKFYAPRDENPSIPLPAALIVVRAIAMDAQKPDHDAHLSRKSEENFFLSVNYLTLLDRFLKDDA